MTLREIRSNCGNLKRKASRLRGSFLLDSPALFLDFSWVTGHSEVTRSILGTQEPRAYKPLLAEARRVLAWAISGRSERMPSQFFSNWV